MRKLGLKAAGRVWRSGETPGKRSPKDTLGGVAGQYAFLLLSRILAAVLQAVSVALLARLSSPSELGHAMSLVGVLTVMAGLSDLGLSTLLLRERARDQSSQIALQCLKVNALTSSVLAVVAFMIMAGIGLLARWEWLLYLAPLSLWMASEKNSTMWTNFASADGRTWLTSVSILVRRGVPAALLLPLTGFMEPLLAYSISCVVGGFLGNVVVKILLRNEVGPLGKVEVPVRRLLSRGFPFLVNTLSVQVRTLDVALVSAVSGGFLAGIYAIPARLTSPLRMVPTAMSSVILRLAARRTHDARRVLLISGALVMGVSTIGLVVVVVAAPLIIQYAVGEAYESAVPALQILCAGLIAAFYVSLRTSYLQGMGRERYVGGVSSVVTVYVLVAVPAGALIWGASGGAAGLASSYVVNAALLSWSGRKKPNLEDE